LAGRHGYAKLVHSNEGVGMHTTDFPAGEIRSQIAETP
jgi:hypothetical protein